MKIKSFINKTNLFLFLLIILIFIISNTFLREFFKPLKKIEAKLYRSVNYIELKEFSNIEFKRFAGVTEAGDEVVLSFKVSGKIDTITVNLGDFVRKGQLVVTLDPQIYMIELQERKFSLLKAESNKKNKSIIYERAKKLYIQRHIAKQELDNARYQTEIAEAELKFQQEAVKLSALNLDYTKLYSPMDSTVSELYKNPNENVKVGTPVMLLSSIGEPSVKVSIPEIYIFRINKGDEVKVRFDILPTILFDGTVEEVGYTSGSASTIFPVKIKLVNPPPEYRVGLSTEVIFRFIRQDIVSPYVISSNYVLKDEKGNYVFVLAGYDENRSLWIVERKNVEIGRLLAEGLEIQTGLNAGDKIVTTGLNIISPGDIVKLEEQKNAFD